MSPLLLGWISRLLWAPQSTRKVMGLPRSINARVLEALEYIEPETPPERVLQIQEEARLIFRECLWERHVPEHVYQLVIHSAPERHRVVRTTDHRSWTLRDFDDFIDLGLHPTGSV